MKHDLFLFKHLIIAATPLEPNERPDLTQVRGQLTFHDQSVLYIRENYVTATGAIDYAYHWQTADHQLIRRWDNAHDVPLPTSPNHQHIGTQENIVASEPMTLQKVLTFISSQLTSS